MENHSTSVGHDSNKVVASCNARRQCNRGMVGNHHLLLSLDVLSCPLYISNISCCLYLSVSKGHTDIITEHHKLASLPVGRGCMLAGHGAVLFHDLNVSPHQGNLLTMTSVGSGTTLVTTAVSLLTRPSQTDPPGATCCQVLPVLAEGQALV